MENHHRTADSGPARFAGLLGAVVRWTSSLLLWSLLAGCGSPAGDGALGDRMHDQEVQEKLPIIVHLHLGEGTGGEEAGDDAIAAVTARVMERLKETMSAEDLAAVRTFNLFPIIALSAEADLIARLLAMPEVESIERDRELQPLEDALSAGSSPSGLDLQSE